MRDFQAIIRQNNLQSENKKTYRLNPDGKSATDMNGNTPVLNPDPLIVNEVLLHSLSVSKGNPSCT
jgi:hypothetical protein